MNIRLEKLFNLYLISVVGPNPVLRIETKQTTFLRSMRRYLTTDLYYINNIKVGSKAEGATKISMDMELYKITRTLFGLKPDELSEYFNDWISKIPSNEFRDHIMDNKDIYKS
jgi:hypothetical protein